MNILRRLLLILFAVIAGSGLGFLSLELILRGLWGNPVTSFNRLFAHACYARTIVKGSGRFHDARGVWFPATKAPRTKRIVILGESTADLFWESSDTLVRLLKYHLPEYSFEIINCGIGGGDTSRILRAAREAATLDPDLFLVFIGNNVAYQPLNDNVFLDNALLRVVTSHSWLIQKILIPRCTKYQEVTESLYVNNLASILSIIQSSNAQALLFTLPTNIRDFPPLGDYIPWSDRNVTLARLDIEQGRYGSALKRLEPLLKKTSDVRNMRASYYAAQALGAMGKISEMTAFFKHAADKDRGGNRCTTRTNRIIRALARQYSCRVIDLEREFIQISEFGLPGNTLFYDYCHWWHACNELISSKVIASLRTGGADGSPLLGSVNEWQSLKLPPFSLRRLYSDCLQEQAESMGSTYLNGIANAAYRITHDIDQSVYCLSRVRLNDPELLRLTIENKETAYKELTGEYGLPINRQEFDTMWYMILCAVGETYRRAGEYGPALRYLSESIGEQPDQINAWLFRGFAHYSMKNFASANSDWQKVVLKEPAYDWLLELDRSGQYKMVNNEEDRTN